MTAVAFTGKHCGKTRLWRCVCDCGTECEVMLSNLRSGHTQSCGCLNRDQPPAKKFDLAGQRCGRLTVLEITPRRTKGDSGNYLWRCVCDCGTTVEVSGTRLRSGRTRSCGCLHTDAIRSREGVSVDARLAWRLWLGIRDRCHNPRSSQYPSYGGRGISLYEPWREFPWKFAEWLDDNLGPRPEGYSLDRIDNDGNYEPGNLRWASRSTQQRNQRRRLSVAGKDAEKLRAYAATHGITPAHALTLAIERLTA